MALFLFLGPKPRGLNFAEIYARGGRGLQRPTFRDLIPPWGHSPFGPGRGGTAPFRGGRSSRHRAVVPGRRARGAAGLGGGRWGTRGAGPAARSGPGAGTRRAMRAGGGARGAETGPCGRSSAGIGRLPGPGRRGGVWAKRGQIRAGAGARRRPSGGCTGRRRGRGAGAAALDAAAQHAVSGGVCRVWGAPRWRKQRGAPEKLFSLYKEARRSAGFSLSNQSCSGPITLCFRSGCFFGGAE